VNQIFKFFRREVSFKINRWTLLTLLIGVFISLPIFLILFNITNSTENWEHLKENTIGIYLKSTFILILGTSALTIIFGVSTAWMVTNYDFPGCRFFNWALILPMSIPTYIAAYSYFDVLEYLTPTLIWIRNNFGQDQMNLFNEVFVYITTIVVLSSVLYPYVYLLTRASFLNQGTQYVDVARTLGCKQSLIFWKVGLPLARPAIFSGVSLVIMETLNDYGAVKHFGIPTLTSGIFRTWMGLNDITSALRLSSYLIIFIVMVLLLEKWLRQGARFDDKSGFKIEFENQKIQTTQYLIPFICCIIPLSLGFLIPVLRLCTWGYENIKVAFNVTFLKIIINSMGLALFSSLLVGFIAIILVFSERYFKSTILRLTNRFASVGYSLPGAVIAIAMLLLVGHFTKFTGWILSGSIGILIFAYLIRFLAVAKQPIDSGVEKYCDQINETSRSIGTTAYQSLVSLNLPLLKNTIVAATLFVFVDTLKELPLTLILRPFNFETLATYTFDLAVQAQIPESSLPALFIILVATLPVIWLNRQMEYNKI
tara:strand:- start:26 stop:1645 length:1620 start_codon:yes stop_codon:yes gene_type:complete